jgi:hypothetical protein
MRWPSAKTSASALVAKKKRCRLPLGDRLAGISTRHGLRRRPLSFAGLIAGIFGIFGGDRW